jgi:NTP pyrophosphatase (non-canonical NTP hydrolase)
VDIDELKAKLRAFAAERDWDQFHSPKNLAMALSVEVAELLELFQWLSEEESHSLSAEVGRQAAEEIADIQIYLVRLADKLGVDIDSAVGAKIESNKIKYPADKVRGKASKYTEYEA